MESGSETRRGLSKKGEDRLVAMPELGLFAVFDGHAGHEASDFAARELPEKLRKMQQQQQQQKLDQDSAKELLASAIAETERDFLAQAEAGGLRAGTTACVAMATEDLVVVANVGDSRAIAFQDEESSRGFEAVALSQDHKPKLPSERAKIEAAGGKVVHDGVSYRLQGGLGLSRALGDKEFKKHQGLSAEPEFRVWIPPPHNCRPCFLVLASDGAFEKLSVKALGEIVHESRHDSAQSIAARIVQSGVRVDDISVVVVKWH